MKKYMPMVIGLIFDLIMLMVNVIAKNVYFEIWWATLLICQAIGLVTIILHNAIQEKQ